MMEPKYMPLVRALSSTQPAGKVVHVTVMHDDWCSIFDQEPGPCDCEPELAPVDGAS